MKVYIVVRTETYGEYRIEILGVYKDKKDAEKRFIDYILGCSYYEDRTVEDLTNDEKRGIEKWDYWPDDYRLVIREEIIQ